VFNSEGGLESFRSRASKWSIGVRLREAGYTTAFIGKYLNGYELDPSYVPPGWDEWFGLAGKRFLTGYDYQANHNGRMERYGDRDRDYQTDVLSRVATDFVDEHAPGDRPLLLTLFPSAPHSPIRPAPRDEDHAFADADLPGRANDGDDLAGKPIWLREGHGPITGKEEEEALVQYRDGLGSLMAVDDMVGRIASRLRAAGELANTVFIFSSDNGFSFGSHQYVGKLVPYEESARVPLAISGPGIPTGTRDQIVAHIDIAPTLYELAGRAPAEDVDGRSLVPLLGGGAPERWRDDLLIEYRPPPALPFHTMEEVRRAVDTGADTRRFVPDYRALRTDRWHYVEWYAGDEHDYELYDMRADPYQLENLMASGEPAGVDRDVVDGLHARLEELAACSGPACRAG
jgi:arylsulfatase A-like enzyme